MNGTKNHIDSVAMKLRFVGMALPDERKAAEDFCLFFSEMLYTFESPEIYVRAFYKGKTPFLANSAVYTLPADHEKLKEDLQNYRFSSIGFAYFGKKKLNVYKKKPSERAFEVFRSLEREREGIDIRLFADEHREMLLKWFMGHDAELSDFTIPFSEYGQVSELLHISYGLQEGFTGLMCDEERLAGPLNITAWFPRFLTNGSFSPEQQQAVMDKLSKLCEAYPTSMAVLSTETFYRGHIRFAVHDELRPYAEYDFSNSVPGVGWGVCLSKQQIELLGGFDAIEASAPIHSLIRYQHGGGMLQLTPDINSIEQESLLAFRDYLNPFLPHGEISTSAWGLLERYCRLPIREEDFVYYFPDDARAFLKLRL